jgi:hypothetical protein
MIDLSPAAQAVLDALCMDELNGPEQLMACAHAAAALRAAAYANMPPVGRTPWLSGYFNETFRNYQSYGEYLVCENLLAIAAELEGSNG